jgi:hypothetical protein
MISSSTSQYSRLFLCGDIVFRDVSFGDGMEQGRKRINNKVAQRGETTGTWAHSAEVTRTGTRADAL